MRSLGWRSIYMFVSLLALLGATGSQSKIVEFICKQLGGSNKCPAMPTCPAGEALRHKPHSKVRVQGHIMFQNAFVSMLGRWFPYSVL